MQLPMYVYFLNFINIQLLYPNNNQMNGISGL